MGGGQDTGLGLYLSKVARARKKIDLAEAVRRLEVARGWSRGFAIEQIRAVIMDGGICWMWEDEDRPRSLRLGGRFGPLDHTKFGFPDWWDPDEQGCVRDVEGNYRVFLIDEEQLKWWFGLGDIKGKARPGPTGPRFKRQGLVEEMRELVASGHTRHSAASKLAGRCERGQSLPANVRWLTRNYEKVYGEKGK